MIDINSIGDKHCRPKIRKVLTQYFSKFKKNLCDDCQRRLETNPFRLLDCKEASCQPIKAGAPQIIDLLDDDCKKHFQIVLEYLDELDIPYDLNRYLVRGLDYYTKTVFELREIKDDRRQSSIGGGGRYDELIELFGGPNTPAVGLGLGLDRIIDILKENNIPITPLETPDVCVIQLGDIARRFALTTIKNITRAGYNIITAPGKDSLKGQMRLANKVKAKLAIIIGQKEALDKTVIIKNLDDGSQETVTEKQLLKKLESKLNSIK
jgi:histidyl-tRNA synthetase